MTRTLLVLPRFPNDRSGTGQRSRLLLEGAMAAGETHVALVDGAERAPGPEALQGVASITSLFSERITPRKLFARRLGGGLRLLAPGLAYAPDPALRQSILDLVRRHRIDTLIFRYTPLFCAAGVTAADGVKVLVDVDDRDDQKYHTRLARLLGARLSRTWVAQKPLRHLARLLQARLSQASHVWFATAQDIWPLDRAQVSLLPNVPYGADPGAVARPSATDQTLLFVGIFNHLPNRDGVIWFLEECWPEIVRQCPDAKLRIVGRGDWGSLADQVPGAQNVDFVGEVDDLTPEYLAARLTICPVREGGGSKIKVIEAAAFARPVVSTSHSLRGFEGLQAEALRQADEPKAFSAACIDMLSDPALADCNGAALRDWQQGHYSRQSFVEAVREVVVS